MTRPATLTPSELAVLQKLCSTGDFMRLRGHDAELADRLCRAGLAEQAWFSAWVYRSTESGDDHLFGALA